MDGPTASSEDRGSRPVPDPTVLTTEQLLRAIESERDYVDGQIEILRERLAGIDRATELRLLGITQIPDDIDRHVTHLSELMDGKFESVALQFKERDTRSERESRDNKVAVDAAFAAQKEAASEQNKSNTLAIDKSEKATAETLNKQADLFKSTTDALASKIEDQKDRFVADLNALKDAMAIQFLDLKNTRAANEGGVSARATSLAVTIAVIGALSGLVGIGLALFAATR